MDGWLDGWAAVYDCALVDLVAVSNKQASENEPMVGGRNRWRLTGIKQEGKKIT